MGGRNPRGVIGWTSWSSSNTDDAGLVRVVPTDNFEVGWPNEWLLRGGVLPHLLESKRQARGDPIHMTCWIRCYPFVVPSLDAWCVEQNRARTVQRRSGRRVLRQGFRVGHQRPRLPEVRRDVHA